MPKRSKIVGVQGSLRDLKTPKRLEGHPGDLMTLLEDSITENCSKKKKTDCLKSKSNLCLKYRGSIITERTMYKIFPLNFFPLHSALILKFQSRIKIYLVNLLCSTMFLG